MKRIAYALAIVLIVACNHSGDMILQNKLDDYKEATISTPDLSGISDNGKEVLDIYRLAADEVDKIYWKQYFGDKALMDKLSSPLEKEYAMINYGPWDRLNGESFIKGYGKRPVGANFYPADMTAEEFAAFDDPDKTNPYTIIRRNDNGDLETVWYHEEYEENIEKISNYLHAAANITILPSVREYLIKKADALKTDDYYESSLAWLDMSDSKMDLIIGPNETTDDHLYGIKRSFGAYVLLKNLAKTQELSRFVALIPELQKELPIAEEYKTYQPGLASTIYACDALYYAGESNAGIKDVALNLPFDYQVQKEKGTKTIILKNVLEQKFNCVVHPTGVVLLNDEQLFYLSRDAFFWNVTFREVVHGLGVKETVNGLGSVNDALGSHAHLWEEMKCNVLGVYLSYNLIKKHTINGIILPQSAITTFITSLVRSERFGTEESIGQSNVIIYNYLHDNGAITHRHDGKYDIDYDKAYACLTDLAGIILKTQATGDVAFAEKFESQYGKVSKNYDSDSFNLQMAGVPIDIRFKFAF